MNVFVLTTGRSGSLAFAEACRHMTNYSAGHETRVGLIGPDRLAYPANHIEVDNRLAWFPGRLQAAFGDDAFYVHLRRDPEATAASLMRRWNKPAMRSYRNGILWDVDAATDRMALARDLVETLDSNIRHYLRDKTRTMTIEIETVRTSFPQFWERVGAEGDLEAALAEFDARHHEGTSTRATPRPSTAGSGRKQRPGEGQRAGEKQRPGEKRRAGEGQKRWRLPLLGRDR